MHILVGYTYDIPVPKKNPGQVEGKVNGHYNVEKRCGKRRVQVQSGIKN